MQGSAARRSWLGDAVLTTYLVLTSPGIGTGMARLRGGLRAAVLVFAGLWLLGVPGGRALLAAFGYAALALAGASAPLISGTATLLCLGGLVGWSLGVDVGALRPG